MKKLFKKVVFSRFKRVDKRLTADESGLVSSNVIVNQHCEDSNNLYDITDEQLQNLEYEEITLYRANRNARLGLTLWYENDGDMETNIYVSKVETGSLVDLDGRIRIGDQILQICGMDVHTKNQAVELLTHCNKIVKFLVVRNLPQQLSSTAAMSTSSLPPLYQQSAIRSEPNNSLAIGQIKEEGESDISSAEINTVVLSAIEKDSGISRLTDESESNNKPMNDEDSNSANRTGPLSLNQKTEVSLAKHVLSADDVVSTLCADDQASTSQVNFPSKESNQPLTAGRFSSESSIIAASLQQQSKINQYSISQTQCDKANISLEHDLLKLRREMIEMQQECDRLLAADCDNDWLASACQANGGKPCKQARTASISVQFPPSLPGDSAKHDISKNIAQNANVPTTSTSAYNTGNDSYPSSAPLTPQQAVSETPKFDEDKESVSRASNSTTIFCPTTVDSGEMAPNGARLIINSTQSNPNVSKTKQPNIPIHRRIWSKKHQSDIKLDSDAKSSNGLCPNTNKSEKLVDQPTNQKACSSISQPSVFRPDRKPTDNGEYPAILADAANLGKTILLQQRLIRQAMIRQAYQLKAQHEQAWRKQASAADAVLRQALTSPYGRFEPSTALPPAGQFSSDRRRLKSNVGPPKIEWKLKKRADGSRYISRRIIRNKILKDRAQQLNSLRTGLSSADDDIFSEMKIGRYWSREERKRHFERSKERRRRQEEMFQKRVEVLALSSEQTVLRLSQQKLHRRQGYELLDQFTTIQEYLSRDTRTVQNKQSLGLLTVTTV